MTMKAVSGHVIDRKKKGEALTQGVPHTNAKTRHRNRDSNLAEKVADRGKHEVEKKMAYYKDLFRQAAFVLRPWLARPKVRIDRRDLSSQEIPVEQKCMERATTVV